VFSNSPDVSGVIFTLLSGAQAWDTIRLLLRERYGILINRIEHDAPIMLPRIHSRMVDALVKAITCKMAVIL
jgi:hypothetical protein